MNIYKITGYSKCGTYFEPYLQSMTIIADTEDQARAHAIKWCRESGYSFIMPVAACDVILIASSCVNGVIDFLNESDY